MYLTPWCKYQKEKDTFFPIRFTYTFLRFVWLLFEAGYAVVLYLCQMTRLFEFCNCM